MRQIDMGKAEDTAKYLAEGFWKDNTHYIQPTYDLGESRKIFVDLSGISPQFAKYFHGALIAWGEMSGVEFSYDEPASTDDPVLKAVFDTEGVIKEADPDGVAAASFNFNDEGYVSEATIKIDPSLESRSPSDQYQSILHEIGHVLGLGHPSDLNENLTDFTSMDYLRTHEEELTLTPMISDFIAIQKLYNHTLSVNEENTVYSLDGSSWEDDYVFLWPFPDHLPFLSEKPVSETIWDTEGIDTIDLSWSSVAQTINLTMAMKAMTIFPQETPMEPHLPGCMGAPTMTPSTTKVEAAEHGSMEKMVTTSFAENPADVIS